MFSRNTIAEIAAVAADLGVEPAALLAIAEVESGGKAFAVIEGRSEPLIRFEGHHFDRRLSPEKRTAARVAGLASPLAGKIANPGTQQARWRLVAKAAAIDRSPGRLFRRSPSAATSRGFFLPGWRRCCSGATKA